MSKILFWDLETTGLSKDKNEILNIAAIVYNTDTRSIGATYNEFVKPEGGIVPWVITNLTGITTAMVQNAEYEGIALYEFMEWVQKQQCDTIAGHNIKIFDLPFLAARLNKYKIKSTMPIEFIDTLDLAKQAYAAGVLKNYNFTTAKGNLSFRLECLMNYFNLGTQEHRALTDVQFNIMVYQRLQDLMEQQDFGF